MGSWGGTWSGQTGVLLSGAGATACALTKAPARRWWWLPQRDRPGVPSVRTLTPRFQSPELREVNACLSAAQAVGLVPAASADPQRAGRSFSCWTPRVLLSCLDASSHLPPGHRVSHPQTGLGVACGSDHVPWGEAGSVVQKRDGRAPAIQAPGAGKGRASAKQVHGKPSSAHGLK